jgi:hypothetical protein
MSTSQFQYYNAGDYNSFNEENYELFMLLDFTWNNHALCIMRHQYDIMTQGSRKYTVHYHYWPPLFSVDIIHFLYHAESLFHFTKYNILTI